jgi:hypothetical protein
MTRRAGTCRHCCRLVPYLVLLRVGFAVPASLLRRRCALTAPFHPYPAAVAKVCVGRALLPASAHRSVRATQALTTTAGRYIFCGTFRRVSRPKFRQKRNLERATLPDVIRHTALRSSDFPPRPFSPASFNGGHVFRFAKLAWQKGRSDRPVRLPACSV